MSDAQILRDLSAAPAQLALQAGADALDDNPRLRDLNTRLQATIAGLEDSLAAAVANARPLVPATYTVQPKETLLAIGRRYLVQAMDIKAWNRLPSDTIQPGQVLYLTGPAPVPEPTPPPVPVPEPQPAGQFPGDPGPDRIIVGIDVTRGAIDKVRAREAAIGMKLANRVFNGGISDFAVPNGPIATRIKRDIAEGRMPLPSGKPGIEALAAHKYEAELLAFFKWYQGVLTAADKYGGIIFHHEPSNDWEADNNNLPAMAKHKADHAEAQRWIRRCMNQAFKRSESRILFAGAYMTYEWSTQGVKQWGSADLLNPGMDPDNPTKHVFDLGCGDHYNPDLNATTLERPQLTAFLASMKKWGVQPGLTELGVKTNNPKQAEVLKNFLAKAKTLGIRLIILWDSEAGAGGGVSTDPDTYWTMKPETLSVYKDFCLTQGANPNA